MKDYIGLWLDGRSRQKPRTISGPIRALGKFDGYLVYAIQRVEIELEVEPSSSFEVVNALHRNEEVWDNGLMDGAIFGLLDVLMVADSEPICDIRVVVKDVDYDRIECSPRAFRLAGRDAGQKIIESMKEVHRS